jgi:hypothetical protein
LRADPIARDRTGQRVQLHYAPDKAFNPWGRSPRPHAITDASGRQLSLHWSNHGQLQSVQLHIIRLVRTFQLQVCFQHHVLSLA